VHSPEHLLAQTTLYLHRVHANLPESKQRMIEEAQLRDPVMKGRKVLVVDDDVRNIFALATILERYQMEVLHSESAHEGIAILEKTPDVDIILMDIMMPRMDGYTAIRTIREMPGLDQVPIIALTAKAMDGDRAKCIAAGASDYIAKPVDVQQLLSLLRVWLRKRIALRDLRA
jgi:CheY-like chemotaxis protein